MPSLPGTARNQPPARLVMPCRRWKAPPEAVPGGGIMTLLERHGVHAVSLHVPRDRRGVARIIDEAAQQVGAELLVMGAFEHSKFSQDLFGGVTHEILKSARIPVLMSH